MSEDREFYEEEVDGGVLRLPATRWRNPGAHPCTMQLHVSGPRENPRWQMHMPTTPANPCMLPPKVLHVVIPPGGEALVPSMLDPGVQRYVCHHPVCVLTKPFDCKDVTHPKEICGGLGPGLQRVSPAIAPMPPRLSRALEPALPQVSPESIDDRLLQRAKRGAS